MWGESLLIGNCWTLLLVQALTGVGMYVGVNLMLKSVIQKEIFAFIRGKKSDFV